MNWHDRFTGTPPGIDDVVLQRNDGVPAYNLAWSWTTPRRRDAGHARRRSDRHDTAPDHVASAARPADPCHVPPLRPTACQPTTARDLVDLAARRFTGPGLARLAASLGIDTEGEV